MARRKNAEGQAPEYSEDLAALVCALVSTGKSLDKACAKAHPNLTDDIVYLWLFRSPEFVIAFREAKRSAMYKYLEETIDIADDESGDTYTDFSKDGDKIEKPNGAKVNRDKLKVAARQWAMQNMNREVFGEQPRGGGGGGEGETIIRIEGGLPDE